MSWTKLLASRTVQPHATSKNEIDGLRDLIERDLRDADINELSDDRRFATAYNAVLQLSKMALACSGYRVPTGAGHHQKTFEGVRVSLASSKAESFADYFETCRRKRNAIDYDGAEIVTETESNELLQQAKDFKELVENWITKTHPAYHIPKT